MTPKGWFICIVMACATQAETCWGQHASNWRVYKMADGLPESACVSVTFGQQGRILAKHLNRPFVSELDGYSVNLLPSPDLGPSRVYGSPAGQLWAATTEGLREFKEDTWEVHTVPEIAAEFRGGQAMRSVPLCPVRQGVVLFLLPDRLMEFNVEQPGGSRVNLLRAATQTRLEKFTGLSLARDGGLWIAGTRGLAKVQGPARSVKPDSDWREFLPPQSLNLQEFQEPWEDVNGGVTLLAESGANQQKLVAHFDGQQWTALPAGNEKIRRAWRGPDRTFWAATIDSLFQFEPGSHAMAANQEISARAYYDLAVEPNGAFWLATSDGLFRYGLLAWQSPLPLRKFNSVVHGFAEDADGRVWFASGAGLHVLEANATREYPFPADAEQISQPGNPIFALRDGTFLIEANNELYQFQPARAEFRVVSTGEAGRRLRPLGFMPDGNVCVRNASRTSTEARLEIFDGQQFQPLLLPLPDSLAAVRVLTLFAARNGDLWLGGENGLAWYHEKQLQAYSAADSSNPEGTHSFVELPDGKIWCATLDRIWEFGGKNWRIVRSGFDHINSLARGRDGSVWVASNSGLHQFYQGEWIELGLDDGLPSANVREIFEDQRGRLWAGTTLGLRVYQPQADPDPPQTSIRERAESENIVPEGGTIALSFTGVDKWKLTARQRLLYSHRLDERDWSPFQELDTVRFTDLPAGKHYFQVRAMDRNGNVDPEPARLEFAVAVPWYKETRLLLIALAGLAVALFFAGLAFNRHRQLVRSHAEVEKQVAQRTLELERASRELLHSQKMNALGTLAAGLAHDFNNILSIVKGSAQIIEDNVDNAEKIRTRADRIKMVADQGAGIVKALLGFSRDSAHQPAVCDLNSVVEDTIKLLGDRFLREVEIQFAPTPGLPEVRATRDFIQQILLNFIFNAAESMNASKRVILSARCWDTLPVGVVLKPATAPGYVAVSVQDFGAGISPENLPRIFEPFFTTKAFSTRRGTGLGLSMVYELARKMEAGLAVQSAVNQGTTITLILPLHEVTASEKNESHAQRVSRS